MWEFLHKFRIHHWNTWYWSRIGIYPEQKLYTHIYRSRYCPICKKKEIKLIKKTPVRI